MRIVIAPDKFKDCLTAAEVAEAIAEGVRRVLPGAEIDLCPMADGGEGTVDALVAGTNGRMERRRVMGPRPTKYIGRRVERFSNQSSDRTGVQSSRFSVPAERRHAKA